jgi:hypothetical protein
MHASTTGTAVFLSFLASCGGASEPIAPFEFQDAGAASPCGAVRPCGGDIVGTWEFTSVCAAPLPPLPAFPSCPESSVQSSPHLRGNAIYRSDGTYRTARAIGAMLAIHFPASCLGELNCSELEQRYRTGDSFDSVACSAGSDGCHCEVTKTSTETVEEGHFTVTDGRLFMTSSTGQGRSTAYCVQGSELVEQLGTAVTIAKKTAQ